jgi:hypothetical protein
MLTSNRLKIIILGIIGITCALVFYASRNDPIIPSKPTSNLTELISDTNTKSESNIDLAQDKELAALIQKIDVQFKDGRFIDLPTIRLQNKQTRTVIGTRNGFEVMTFDAKNQIVKQVICARQAQLKINASVKILEHSISTGTNDQNDTISTMRCRGVL